MQYVERLYTLLTYDQITHDQIDPPAYRPFSKIDEGITPTALRALALLGVACVGVALPPLSVAILITTTFVTGLTRGNIAWGEAQATDDVELSARYIDLMARTFFWSSLISTALLCGLTTASIYHNSYIIRMGAPLLPSLQRVALYSVSVLPITLEYIINTLNDLREYNLNKYSDLFRQQTLRAQLISILNLSSLSYFMRGLLELYDMNRGAIFKESIETIAEFVETYPSDVVQETFLKALECNSLSNERITTIAAAFPLVFSLTFLAQHLPYARFLKVFEEQLDRVWTPLIALKVLEEIKKYNQEIENHITLLNTLCLNGEVHKKDTKEYLDSWTRTIIAFQEKTFENIRNQQLFKDFNFTEVVDNNDPDYALLASKLADFQYPSVLTRIIKMISIEIQKNKSSLETITNIIARNNNQQPEQESIENYMVLANYGCDTQKVNELRDKLKLQKLLPGQTAFQQIADYLTEQGLPDDQAMKKEGVLPLNNEKISLDRLFDNILLYCTKKQPPPAKEIPPPTNHFFTGLYTLVSNVQKIALPIFAHTIGFALLGMQIALQPISTLAGALVVVVLNSPFFVFNLYIFARPTDNLRNYASQLRSRCTRISIGLLVGPLGGFLLGMSHGSALLTTLHSQH